MKNLITVLICLLVASNVIYAQEYWQNPAVNKDNRLPMHSSFFAYETVKKADVGVKEESDNYLTLNGIWNFNWVEHAWQRSTNYYKVDYNDKDWGEMPVPGLWELNGYGDPLYVNSGYAWAYQYKNNPPTVPEEKNHVGTYRKEIMIPLTWSGKEIYAHFGSVTSNISLYVNGKYVGYSEDSKLEAEFDLTKYIKPGKNLIAFQVFRWCDGSYLEDQDFWRFSGVGRDCYLYARNKTHLQNIRVTPDLDENYQNGNLNIVLDLKGKTTVELKLTDEKGNNVAEKSLSGTGKLKANLSIANPEKWTAETPNLYKLTATVKQSGKVLEVIPLKVGFRKIEMLNSQLCVNGKPILFKGVNRHEMDPASGYIVSEERMIQDIQIMKKYNVNAVRTCHYPDNSRWYELCDEYGIYVVAEANVESHGMGYGKETLAQDPQFATAHLERNQRNVQRNINHPSIIVWSLGNEAGSGPNFEKCYTWIKDYDKSRPVQYERAEKEEYTDIYCPMYLGYKACEEYASTAQSRPLIQCEYAHAMGNSMGGFKEYWDLIRKYPLYQGGFIWDFVDQSIYWKNNKGQEIFAYGGDFNAYDASDNNFLDNGLVKPNREPNPHFNEVGYYYQSIWTTPVDLKNGKVEVYNEYFFKDLSDFYLKWELVADGKSLKTGIIQNLKVQPQQKETVDLGLIIPDNLMASEVLVNVAYVLKTENQLVPAGYTLARQQLVVKHWQFSEFKLTNKTKFNKVEVPELFDNDIAYLIVKGDLFQVDFNKKTGFLCKYENAGKDYLVKGSELKPNFWRAPTDNDFGAELQKKYGVWKNPKFELLSLTKENTQEGLAKIVAKYNMPEVSGKLELIYLINNQGEIKISQKLNAGAAEAIPNLFRFGMKMEMPADYSKIIYYGRGPGENYIDRKASEFIGLYKQTVNEQAYDYIRPQETGTKTDIRWWNQLDKTGTGLTFVSDTVYSISALKYTIESLDDGVNKNQRHFPEVKQSDYVTICIDKKQMGLGCLNSWGALPLDKYLMPYNNYSFSFILRPVKHQY